MKRSLTLLAASVAIAFQSFGQVAMPPSRIDLQQQFLLPDDDRQETDPFAPLQPKAAQARKGQSSRNAAQPLSSNAIKQRLDSFLLTGSLSSKNHYFYDSNENVVCQMTYYNRTSTNIWRNIKKIDFAYDANGKQTLAGGYELNMSTNTWVGIYKNEFSYDANGNEILNIGYNSWDTLANY